MSLAVYLRHFFEKRIEMSSLKGLMGFACDRVHTRFWKFLLKLSCKKIKSYSRSQFYRSWGVRSTTSHFEHYKQLEGRPFVWKRMTS